MKFTRLGVLLLATVAALAQEGAPVELMRIESVDSSGEFDLDPSTGEASALQGVVVRYRGSTVTARTLRLDEKHSTVDASGDVRIEIGKDGRTAQAIRTVLSAACSRSGRRVQLDIVD